ncbi:helix-turn-helix domain-containing protein [Bradyrhizobium tropiciagri]|uniref:helix-turn-helix domain-containing protein n=1 Tax=Bradyrhizobium tropiciagri TaxID=312253 RepID=UPI003D9AC13D
MPSLVRRHNRAFVQGLQLRGLPRAAQDEFFRRTIGCCRLVYNPCIDQKIPKR